ncbi:MAG TPA: hypothetical protein VGZ22_08580 [Isosphaeraceae bacterium]|jgi:hydrogenase/urease accessory protein HupE|nr:hypothetical protein [Isosphaeraceae bacterium]
MYVSNERSNQISSAVFLIGLGVLFATGYWWPGIMFVIGVTSIAHGLAQGHGWYAFQGAVWTIGLGVWFALGTNIATLFIIIGISMLVGALVRPPMFAKPQVDNSLE